MKNWIDRIRNSHDTVYKVVLFLLSITFIVYLFPKDAKFKYEFQKQKPWLYNDLLAPFDIPILKSDGQVEFEMDSIRKSQLQYFRWDPSVAEKSFDLFRASIEKNWELYEDSVSSTKILVKIGLKKSSEDDLIRRKQKWIKECKFLLNNVYKRGILEYSDHVEQLGEKGKLVVIKGNVQLEYQKSDFYTSTEAYRFIEKNLMDSDYSLFLLKEMSIVLSTYSANVKYDDELSKMAMEESRGLLAKIDGVIEKGELIILKGEKITEEKYQLLDSYRQKMVSRSVSSASANWILFGQILLVGVVILGLALYLIYFRPKIFEFNTNVVFLLLQVNIGLLSMYLVLKTELSVYIVPFCLIPMIIRAFFDTRTALFVHLTTILLCGFLVPNSFEFLFIQFIAGIGSLLGFVNLRNRAQLFITSSVVFVCYGITYFGFVIIHEGNIMELDWIQFAWLAGGAGLTLFAYPFIYIYEKIFGLVSDLTLLELADTNNDLLRDLSLKAPGTFQHSLQVANLAEAAIYEIEGNSLLVRTGALYHDIGKLAMPRYFIENQGGSINPHDELSYEDSAAVIIGHVSEGIKLAKKHKLPDQIIDFIRTHHGTTMTQYFYRMSVNEIGEEEVEKELYTYPGPIPYSKETAVLMMADSVEAASRSLKEYSAVSITKLVGGIIDNQMKENQFVNADITLREITAIKKLFIKMLMNIYHVRVEYPR